MTTYYAKIGDIKKKLQHRFPIQLTVPDPVSGAEISISREDLVGLLIVDASQTIVDAQAVTALYIEMARFQRACERAAQSAKRAFASWKSEMVKEFYESDEKKKTEKLAEAYYRTHEDYEEHSSVAEYYDTLARLFDDLKWGVKMKAEMIGTIVKERGQLEGAEHVAAELGEDESLDALDEMAAASVQEERVKSKGKSKGKGKKKDPDPLPPPPPEPEDEEDEEDDSEDDSEGYECPECENDIEADATECEHCGTKFEEEGEDSEEEEDDESEEEDEDEDEDSEEEEDDESEDEDEDEDDEEEPPPPPPKRKPRTGTTKSSAKKGAAKSKGKTASKSKGSTKKGAAKSKGKSKGKK